jgi:spore maturation protein CgeB
MLADSALTMESAVKQFASQTDSLIETNFALHMQAYFLVDTYLRSYLREKMVTALVDHHYPLALYGGNWEQMPCKDPSSLTIHAGIPYDRSFELMTNAKVVLNVMPLFKAGSHDRVVASMLNHSVSLSDTSLYLEEHFTNKKDIVLYSIDNVDSLLQAVDLLMHDETLAEEIAENGYQTACRFHTWSNRMEELLPFITSIVAP